MSETLQLDWSAVENLLPLCVEFYKEKKEGTEIDAHDAVNRVGNALGIEDVDKFALEKADEAFNKGFGEIMDEENSQKLAAVFTSACVPVMKSVYGYVQGDIGQEALVGNLNELFFDNANELGAILQNQLGIPNEIANPLAEKLGVGAISIYCFVAAYKIYQKAAQDAELAKEERIKAERHRDETVAYLKAQREEVEGILSTYLLDRLEPFNEGITALDQAVLNDDDDQYIAANAALWSLFGRKAQYRNASEFESLMLSDEAFKL